MQWGMRAKCVHTHTPKTETEMETERERKQEGRREGKLEGTALGLGCSSSGDEDGRSHGRRGGSTLVAELISGIHWMTDFFSQIRKYTRYSSCATSQTTQLFGGAAAAWTSYCPSP